MKGTQATRLQVIKEIVESLRIKSSQARDTITKEDIFHPKGTSQQ
jgi:hypothetical protein